MALKSTVIAARARARTQAEVKVAACGLGRLIPSIYGHRKIESAKGKIFKATKNIYAFTVSCY